MAKRLNAPVTDITALPPAGQSGTVTLRLPGDMRLHELGINVQQGQAGTLTTPAAATRSQIETAITGIRINHGTRLLRRATAAQVFTMLAFNGYQLTAGILPILFSEPWRGTVMAEEICSWDLWGTRGLTVEIDVVVPAAGTFFSITAHRKYDFLRNIDSVTKAFVGRYILWHLTSENFTQGSNTRDIFPKNLPWHRMHIFAAAGATKIARSIVRLNSVPEYDLFNTAARPEYLNQLAPYKFAAQTGHYAILGDYDQQINSYFDVNADTLQSIELETTAVDTPAIIFEQQTQNIN